MTIYSFNFSTLLSETLGISFEKVPELSDQNINLMPDDCGKLKGYKMPIEFGIAISEACKGRTANNKGKPNPAQVFSYLSGQDPLAPAADWNVGHYIAVVGQVAGSKRKMAVCADTYRTIGWQGTHLQPFDRIADSLRRDDSEFSGGAFIVVSPSAKEQVLKIANGLNLRSELWDNGTPFMDLPN
jgi:hypothetical protein